MNFIKIKLLKQVIRVGVKKCRNKSTYKWSLNNLQKSNQIKKQWKLKNSEKNKKINRLWYLKNPKHYKQWCLKNSEKRKQYSKHWKLNNPEKIKQYEKEKRKKDLNYRIIGNLRCRINIALKGYSKSVHTEKLLGCTILKFRQHLESQFIEGMSWDNYGRKEGQWSIDHKIPLSSFKHLDDPEEQKQACNYKNCQPLWHIDNIRKGNRIIKP